MQNPSFQQSRPSKRTAPPRTPRPTDEGFHEEQAIVVLDEEGTIQHISRVARRMLDFRSSPPTGQSFFDRVHPAHLHRVLWDLSEMVSDGVPRLAWLLRLKTGLGSWQWYKLNAVNRLGYDEGDGIILQLFERGGRQRIRPQIPR